MAPKAQTFEIRLPRDQVAQTSERGFVFEMMYPVDTPGPYEIRAAARDVASKKVGSAAQFQEVPDLRRGQLALSGIEMRSAASPDPAMSSAVRRFAPGAPLTYAFTVFHPKAAPRTPPKSRRMYSATAAWYGPASRTRSIQASLKSP